MAKYIGRLRAEERTQLTELISRGRRAASVLTRAQILLKADTGRMGPAWSKPEIEEAIETGRTNVHRVRQTYVEDGVATPLERRLSMGRQYYKLDGAQESPLIAMV
jgi:hypothetical protein